MRKVYLDRIAATPLRPQVLEMMLPFLRESYGNPQSLHLAGVEFIEGKGMLLNADLKGVACSSGSACTSKSLKASHVLLAMGLDHALAQGSLVFSLLETTVGEAIDHVLEVFPPIIDKLRRMSPLYTKYLEE